MRNKNRNALTLTFVLLLGSVSGRTDADNGNGPHPRLDTPSTFTTTSRYRATGVDPLAPRSLVLWSWNGDRFSRVSSTMSGSRSRLESSGRFDFGEQSIPADGLTLHVAPLGDRADPARLLRVETPVPAPSVVSGGLESREIVFAPASPRGELRFYDADSGRLLLRKRIESNDRNRVILDLEADLHRPWPAALLIEQSLEDGRRSARQLLYLD